MCIFEEMLNINSGKRYDLHVKNKAVERVLAGEKRRDVCGDLGVSRSTLWKWIKRYSAEGILGLDDQSQRPHRIPNQKTKEEVDTIVEIALDYPDFSYQQLCLKLKEMGNPISVSTLHKYLKQRKLPSVESRLKRLIKKAQLTSDQELTDNQVVTLEKLVPQFRDRNKIVKSRGTDFFVTFKDWKIPYSKTQVRVWYFIELHSFRMEAIVEPPESPHVEEYALFESKEPLPTDFVEMRNPASIPVLAWWDVYGEHWKSKKIKLHILDFDLLAIGLSDLKKELSTDIFIIRKHTATDDLPWAYIQSAMSRISSAYREKKESLWSKQPFEERLESITSEISEEVGFYNGAVFGEFFPIPDASPDKQARTQSLFSLNPSFQLRDYSESKNSGSKLFWKTPEMYSLPDYQSELSAIERRFSDARESKFDRKTSKQFSLETSNYPEPADWETFSSVSSAPDPEVSVEVDALSTLERAKRKDQLTPKYARISKKKDTSIYDVMDAVPYREVYELIVGPAEPGEKWVCPQCGKKELSYVDKPRKPHKRGNLGICFNCGEATDLAQLLKLCGYDANKAFLWMLANYPNARMATDYPMTDDLNKKYRGVKPVLESRRDPPPLEPSP